MYLPSEERILELHRRLVEMFAQGADPIVPSGPVDGGHLLGPACARPHVGYAGAEKYKTLEAKCAALFHSLTKNHPFHNGNKRTALVTLITTLYSNNRVFKTEIGDDEIYEFTVAVSSDDFPFAGHGLSTDDIVEEMARWIRSKTMGTKHHLGEMDVSDFIARCEQAGGRHKLSGSLHMLTGPAGTVHFNRSTHKLDGPVVRRYLRRIGLTETSAGIELTEIQEGVSAEQEEIRRFRNVLIRLADA